MTQRSFARFWLLGAFAAVFLYAPLAVVTLYSFNASRYGLKWEGFTTHWYEELVRNHTLWSAVSTSLSLAFLSASISTVLGSLLGQALGRAKFRTASLVDKLLLLQVAVPDIVMGISLALFYMVVRSRTGLFNLGFQTLLLAHVTFQIPFVAIVVRSRMRTLDPHLEEAAHDLFASRWQVFRHVTLPLLWPGIVAGALLAFTLSLDDFVVSFFTSGAGNATVPVLVYSSVKRGVTNQINALSTLLIAAPILVTLLLAWLQKSTVQETK